MIAIGAYAAFLLVATALAAKVGLMQMRHYELSHPTSAAAGNRSRLLSVGGLTVLGFALVAAGTIVLLMIFGRDPLTVVDAALFVATRLAILSIVLGVTHFNCLAVLSRAGDVGEGHAAGKPMDGHRPRRAREDPLDRVLEAGRLNAPSGL